MSTETEHRRLAVLRHLAQAADYTSNASILTDVVRGVGVPTSGAQMIAALAWLQQHELIKMFDHGHVTIATATDEGVEVARGHVTYPGVKRPSARS